MKLNLHIFPTPWLLSLFMLCCGTAVAQSGGIRGQLQDATGEPLSFVNIALYQADELAKVETTDDAGLFLFRDITVGAYTLVASYLGAPDLRREISIENAILDLEVLRMEPAAIELSEATVTATRALVEIKPDRTVFNVQGTINAVGDNGLDLLRKAPGVSIDNNDNINVLSRSGVLVYVDGKRLPLGGDDLANYLRNLAAEQIDRIDIITNPGAKYEAEGNAGIIDIRLKKNENEGANGSVSTTVSQGHFARYNLNATGNLRNRLLNIFGSVGYANNNTWRSIFYESFQNGFFTDKKLIMNNRNRVPSFRIGTDFFLGDKHTLGFLVTGQYSDNTENSTDDTDIYTLANGNSQPDSLLRTPTEVRSDRGQNTFNLNYRFLASSGTSLNFDLDYGRFRTNVTRDQPNFFFDPTETTVLSGIHNYFETPTDIDIYTAKADYETSIAGNQFGAGFKLSKVVTANSFLLYDVQEGGERVINNRRSNLFDYDENVYAAYVSYNGQLNDRLSFSSGLRMEITDATGDLIPLDPQLAEPPVDLDYFSLFPNLGVTYAVNPEKGHTMALSYGRRINRPDYNVLNPFRNQLSLLSYMAGNPFLTPEIIDIVELGYTIASRYNIKFAYSVTSNQITRLIGPDDVDPRANFLGWDNLATQTNYSINAALPFTITDSWNAFFNISGGYLDNQATYENGATIDLQAFTYQIYSQQTFKLFKGYTAEVSGFFSGPGIWGGVFEYKTSGALNLGLQKRFLNNQLNAKLSANDIFFSSGWRGTSDFNGLVGTGRGNWDSRRVTLSLSYSFGNQKVKSRKRNTGLSDEAKRVGSD